MTDDGKFILMAIKGHQGHPPRASVPAMSRIDHPSTTTNNVPPPPPHQFWGKNQFRSFKRKFPLKMSQNLRANPPFHVGFIPPPPHLSPSRGLIPPMAESLWKTLVVVLVP